MPGRERSVMSLTSALILLQYCQSSLPPVKSSEFFARPLSGNWRQLVQFVEVCEAGYRLECLTRTGEIMRRAILLFLLFSAPGAFGQSHYAVVSGTITDPQQGPVAGAT